jgi:hypothetical protein
MRQIATVSLFALVAVVPSAPSALAAEGAPEAAPTTAAGTDQAATLSVYCFYVDPAGVGTTQLYPGGKYCVPYPL